MLGYGLFVLIYLALQLAPEQGYVELSYSRDQTPTKMILQKQKNVLSGVEVWKLSEKGESILLSIDKNKHEVSSEIIGSTPIRVTDFVKIPKNTNKIRSFDPSEAMLKEKHTSIIIARGNKRVTLKQKTGWLESLENLQISWK